MRVVRGYGDSLRYGLIGDQDLSQAAGRRMVVGGCGGHRDVDGAAEQLAEFDSALGCEAMRLERQVRVQLGVRGVPQHDAQGC